jgi:hypothetical protein
MAPNVSVVHEAPEPGAARCRGFHAPPDLHLSPPAWQGRANARPLREMTCYLVRRAKRYRTRIETHRPATSFGGPGILDRHRGRARQRAHACSREHCPVIQHAPAATRPTAYFNPSRSRACPPKTGRACISSRPPSSGGSPPADGRTAAALLEIQPLANPLHRSVDPLTPEVCFSGARRYR